MDERIIREPERRRITGIPRATWYRYERRGEVPNKIPLLGRTVGWRYGEIMEWVTGRKPEVDQAEAA